MSDTDQEQQNPTKRKEKKGGCLCAEQERQDTGVREEKTKNIRVGAPGGVDIDRSLTDFRKHHRGGKC